MRFIFNYLLVTSFFIVSCSLFAQTSQTQGTPILFTPIPSPTYQPIAATKTSPFVTATNILSLLLGSGALTPAINNLSKGWDQKKNASDDTEASYCYDCDKVAKGFKRVQTKKPNSFFKPIETLNSDQNYVKHLTDCAYAYKGRFGSGFCAKSVRHAIVCAARRSGDKKCNIHCGGQARFYNHKKCQKQWKSCGFKRYNPNDPICNKKGVIRVYDGVPKGRKGTGTAGDFAGHIEVLGDDGFFISSVLGRQPRDIATNGKRPLTGCYYKHN